MKLIIVSVSNDLSTDQRVNKTCMELVSAGFRVCLVGRIKKDSLILEERPYRTRRLRLFFAKGPLFYFEFNLRLFLYLLINKADGFFSNDLDTLIPNYLISALKKLPLIYDSHELFTEVPELKEGTFKKSIWVWAEKMIIPKLGFMITVNNSIARIFCEKYKVRTVVVKNVPRANLFASINGIDDLLLKRADGKKIVILQGAGINTDRGGEEAIEAFRYIDNAVLFLIGGGNVFNSLKKRSQENIFKNKVFLIDRMPYEDLIKCTRTAHLGLTIDKPADLNYRYSLPNKLFDYIHSGVPVLATRLPEIEKIIMDYAIGDFIENHDPILIAEKITGMLADQSRLETYKRNCSIAALELNWENERKNLIREFKIFH